MKILVLLGFCFSCFLASAQDYTKARELFKQAEHEAQYGSKFEYLSLYQKIQGYPLAPYAESLFLQRYMSTKYQNQIQQLLLRYPNAPFSVTLRKEWLNYLAKKRLKQSFVQQYVDIGDTKLACINLQWQLELGGNKQHILPQVEQLWLSPTSLPKECDPIFNIWKEAGYLNSEVALKRLILAVKAKNFRLLPYLRKQLNNKDKHLAGLWKSAVKKPANIKKSHFFLFYNDAEKDIFLYAVNKLVFARPQFTEQIWQQQAQHFDIAEQDKQAFTKRLALSYAVANHEQGLEKLSKIPDEGVDESVKQWRLAYALENMDWQGTLNVIAELPEQMQTDMSVQYWKARALERLGERQWANDSFNELAERRDYYGFLAASKVGKPAELRHVPISVSLEDELRVKNLPVMKRAYELFKLDRMTQARREWNLLVQQLTEPEQLVAAKVAYDWGWYDRPIFMLPTLGYLNDVNLRFPLAYKSLLSHQAKVHGLDPAFLFAIARRESSFMSDAYSSAGAAGLMQIKPSTASYIAKSKVRKNQLFSPNQNVKLGSSYLAYLMEETKGNPILTTAAYNAGIGRIKTWLPQKEMAADAWIETIPYKETRNYVKAVVAYSKVYQQLLGRDDNTFDDVTDIQISPSL